MTTIQDILSNLESFAPYSLAESWDNCGLLVGDSSHEVTKAIIALDVTQDVINEAISTNCNLIIAHHPVIFTSTKTVNTQTETGRLIISAIKNDISIICMHTNLDSCDGGVNDALANALNLTNIENLGAGETFSLGRVGTLNAPLAFDEFLSLVKTNLDANGLKFVGSGKVQKVAVLGGAGGKLMDFAIKHGCDTYVTSDVSYDGFQRAKSLGINLIDAGHFSTENVICDILYNRLRDLCKISISKTHTDIINFI